MKNIITLITLSIIPFLGFSQFIGVAYPSNEVLDVGYYKRYFTK